MRINLHLLLSKARGRFASPGPVIMTKATIEKQMQAVYGQSRRNLWGLLLFLLAGVAVLPFQTVDLLASVPANWRILLGSPPPAALVDVALVVYTGSSLVLILNRILRGMEPCCRRWDWCLRSVFYLLYLMVGPMEREFFGALAGGLLLFGLEQLQYWFYAGRIRGGEYGATGPGTPRKRGSL